MDGREKGVVMSHTCVGARRTHHTIRLRYLIRSRDSHAHLAILHFMVFNRLPFEENVTCGANQARARPKVLSDMADLRARRKIED